MIWVKANDKLDMESIQKSIIKITDAVCLSVGLYVRLYDSLCFEVWSWNLTGQLFDVTPAKFRSFRGQSTLEMS